MITMAFGGKAGQSGVSGHHAISLSIVSIKVLYIFYSNKKTHRECTSQKYFSIRFNDFVIDNRF